jgi:hypothetical protein
MTDLSLILLESPLAEEAFSSLSAAGLWPERTPLADLLARQSGADAAPVQVVWAGGDPDLALVMALEPGGSLGEGGLGALTLLSGEELPNATLWLACGAQGWWPPAVWRDPAALKVALAWDAALWRRETALREARQAARRQLEERIWVDRAKGVLMSARGIGEDEAFRLLRGASMQTNLKVGQVSRSVLEAAQWADAVNRSGLLRMLSQRVVRLGAERLAGAQGRVTTVARKAMEEALARGQENLEVLAALPRPREHGVTLETTLEATRTAWATLKNLLHVRPTADTLRQADQQAERVLHLAEQLTAALEQAGGRSTLNIINQCGRQRMRVQRLAKQALLSTALGPDGTQADVPALMDDIEQTLAELDRAPLTSTEIQAELALAREQWLQLLRGLRTADTASGRSTLTQSADALLTIFDRLTAAYEHSLQVIMS